MLRKNYCYKDITVTLIEDFAEWESISTQWKALLARSPEASLFNNHCFLTAWWKKRKFDLKKPMILLLQNHHGELLGIAPLMYGWQRQLIFPLRTISFIHDDTFMDRPQFILPHKREDLLEAVFQFLLVNSNKWDTIQLTEQLVDTTYSAVVSRIYQNNKDYRIDIIRESFAPYLTFPSADYCWDDYIAGRTKKHRKKWRYLTNRFQKAGQVSIERYTALDDLSSAFEHYKSIENKSWKKGTKVKLSNWHYNFYTYYSEASKNKSKIHCVILWLDQHPVAGIIGLQTSSKYAALHTSFDSAYGQYSPGFLISGFDIKWAIENGIEEYDLMSGWPSDKLQWTDLLRETSYVRVIRKKACAGLYNFVKFSLNSFILHIGDQTGIRQYLIKHANKKHPPMNSSKFAKQNEVLGDIENSGKHHL
jgi:CelD/BcsL family acetyltransferase involved in cellulose biosynthesis